MAVKPSSEIELGRAAMLGAGKRRGPGGKPMKVVKKIEYERGADGTHVFTHHHTHPEHHPPEVHHFKPKGGTAEHHDAAVDHFIQHAIPPNPGENETMTPAEPEMEAPGAAAGAPGGEPQE
jgi:hypothetical protein